MTEIILRNGIVYDPMNGIDGEVMDICISGAKIAAKEQPGSKVIDLKGKVVMPGGIDAHSHIIGSKIGFGRAMCPEDHRIDPVPKTKHTRGGVGSTMPTSYVTGYRYSTMGYTTVIEPAVPAVKALGAWEELEDLPNLDSAMLPMMGNSMLTFHYISEGDLSGLAGLLAWTLKRVGGYGIKLVNPGGVYAWAHGVEIVDLDTEIPRWQITPREITRNVCLAVESLGLPHTAHLHPINLGRVGNIETTIKHLDSIRDIQGHEGRKSIAHLTHMSFESYDTVDENSTEWSDLLSGGLKLAKYFNKNSHFTTDLGQITFGPATTMTGDGPFEYYLHQLAKRKWTNVTVDVELAGGAGIVPYTYLENSAGNSIQWAIPLEFALSIDDLWRCFVSTDHPNAGPFTKYPLVISWLMSKKQRDLWLKRVHPLASARSTLPDIEREWSLFEVAISTRAAPARILGMDSHKGHLGVGSDADISVYALNPETASAKPGEIVRAFSKAALTIKDGTIVSKNGRVQKTPSGHIWSVHPNLDESLWSRVNHELRDLVSKWYSHSFENYGVPDRYRIPLEKKVEIDARHIEA